MARRKKYQCKIGGLRTNGNTTGSGAATLGVNMGLIGVPGAVLLLRDLDNCGEAGGKVYILGVVKKIPIHPANTVDWVDFIARPGFKSSERELPRRKF
jgi:hypothetical protein